MRRPPPSVSRMLLALIAGTPAWLSATPMDATPTAPAAVAHAAPPAAPHDLTHAAADRAGMLDQYCGKCHNATDWAGGVAFDTVDSRNVAADAALWETVARKLRGGLMPPPGNPRPDPGSISTLAGTLEQDLDTAARATPVPGHIGPHRLNRTEYANAVQDLLGLQVDTEALLPKDVATQGFDNIASALTTSPSYMEQFVTAADIISTLAVGDPATPPESAVYRVDDATNQNRHVPGLSFGTRGGLLAHHFFPADGTYEFSIQGLTGPTYIWGLNYPERVLILIDGRQVFEGRLGGPKDLKDADQRMAEAINEINARFQRIRLRVPAGPHDVGITFVARSHAESDEVLYDFQPDAGVDRLAKVAAVEIKGPYDTGAMSDTPSRRRIFTCRPANAAEEAPCAQQILSTMARKAFRRPVGDADLKGPLAFYAKGRALGGFDKGVQYGLMSILASPKFLYRTEGAGNAGRLDDLALASRLSFFLWSRPPDAQLLDLAANGKLQQPGVLEAQVARMLKDPRAHALVTSFAFGWLGISGLDLVHPDPSIFPEFDPDLREALRTELELFVGSIFDEDRSIIDLLTANHTFVNGRLAEHYGIGSVRGDRFQRVTLTDSYRWGLLGKGAILMTTSYADRTSPVVRGAYVLEHLMGTPPTSPPPNVEAFPENKAGAKPLTVRARLESHRANPSCNACHGVMDPLGLALESFNAIGAWTTLDVYARAPIDTTGKLIDGTPIKGVDDLRRALASHPGQFARTFTEKLLTFALGRTLSYYDMPTVRRIAADAAGHGYRFSSIVNAIVLSEQFRGNAPAPAAADTRQAGIARVP